MAGVNSAQLVYDGDCGICTKLSRVVTRWVRPRPDSFGVAAYQHLDLAPLGLTIEECDAALQWVAPDGTISSAQDAVARLLLSGGVWLRPVGAVILVPGVNALAGAVYRWVARNRHRLPGGTPACALPSSERPA